MLQPHRLVVTVICILLSVWQSSQPAAGREGEGGDGGEAGVVSGYKLNSKDPGSLVCEEPRRRLRRSTRASEQI